LLSIRHAGGPLPPSCPATRHNDSAGRLRTRRREQERAATEIASETSELLRRFAAELSVGDAAVLLGVSKGRISQLRGGSAGRPTAAGHRTGTDG
jgi:hypothetical protein